MGCISESVCGMLSDYHALVTDPRVMKVRLCRAGGCWERVGGGGQTCRVTVTPSWQTHPCSIVKARWVEINGGGAAVGAVRRLPACLLTFPLASRPGAPLTWLSPAGADWCAGRRRGCLRAAGAAAAAA